MCSYNVAYIYVDDVRNAPNISEDIGLITCRSYKQAINAIDHFIQRNVEIILDLDHDLGGIKSGYDVAKYFNTYPQDILFSNNNIYLLPEQLIIYRKL